MRPDRIVVGEVRGPEAFDMLQAMNTGHEGSLTTVHANSPRDALARIENMVLMAGFDLPVSVIREQMASAIHIVLQLSRMTDGSRRVVQLSEVGGMEGQLVTLQDLFVFRPAGLSVDGAVLGELEATGIRPRFANRLRDYGIDLAEDVFNVAKWG
jgi:pilus assembly protein CpaF